MITEKSYTEEEYKDSKRSSLIYTKYIFLFVLVMILFLIGVPSVTTVSSSLVMSIESIGFTSVDNIDYGLVLHLNNKILFDNVSDQ
jgi:uncharacterized membrane protein